MRLERITLAAACLAALLAAGALGAAEAPAGPAGSSAPGAEEAPQPFAHLGYRLLGPAAGGRVSRVAGVPGDPLTYYAATAAGGVWRSVNGGLEWEPVFDDQPVSSIGSIAVAPSDPKVVYVGSGEANIRGNVAEGDGIYKSEDGGGSWRRVWRAEGQVGTVAVHPRDPDVAFAAVLGSPFGPSEERGVYRTTDGGATWRRVLFRDADTGASDVALDPANPRTVFAGLWQARRTPWSLTSGGPGSGLFVSRDGGETWKELRGEGLPGGVWGRVGVGVAPSDPRRVYALIEAEEGGLFRSEDGGATWERANGSRALRQRAWYYTTLTVDPTDAETVWLPQVALYRTLDGGRTLANVEGGGWDYHDVWIDPEDPRRMIAASDAGVSLTWDGGATWTRPPLPISQFYRITTDGRTPYRVLGTIQDWGTLAGPSDSLRQGGVLLADWYPVGGGEAGWVAVHPEDPDTVWAGEYLGYVSRWDGRTGRVAHVGIYPDNGSGHPASDLRYRFQWTAPILASRHHPGTVYHAANVLFRSADGGQSWQQVSPDLTRDDPEKQGWSGGPITGDITGVETYCTIFALAESPLDPAVLWAGTDDGRIHVTRDAGGTWTEVT
ncbi:MAG TPA: glycosyl hydrolase, partial [Thermoanaerobaculia bacterium]